EFRRVLFRSELEGDVAGDADQDEVHAGTPSAALRGAGTSERPRSSRGRGAARAAPGRAWAPERPRRVGRTRRAAERGDAGRSGRRGAILPPGESFEQQSLERGGIDRLDEMTIEADFP